MFIWVLIYVFTNDPIDERAIAFSDVFLLDLESFQGYVNWVFFSDLESLEL